MHSLKMIVFLYAKAYSAFGTTIHMSKRKIIVIIALEFTYKDTVYVNPHRKSEESE